MQKLEEANNDIKETWKILNSALGKRSQTITVHKLEVNDNDVSDSKKISDELNSYFCNIAEDILKDSDNRSVSNVSVNPKPDHQPEATPGDSHVLVAPGVGISLFCLARGYARGS